MSPRSPERKPVRMNGFHATEIRNWRDPTIRIPVLRLIHSTSDDAGNVSIVYQDMQGRIYTIQSERGGLYTS